jgi:hypothetical protein
VLLGGGGMLGANAQVLFDAAWNTLPASQGWTFGALGPAGQTLTNGSVELDSTVPGAIQAGYTRIAPSPLNRTNGFTFLFSAQVRTENHSSPNRAGFSVIVLGADKLGIELGFWTNLIFAQAQTPLFTHAEDVSFTTSTGHVNYTLTFQAAHYVLRADGILILTGPLRDYSAFTGFPDVYETPNFLFLGDDTSSATAVAGIRRVALVQPPSLKQISPGAMTWTGVSNLAYRVEFSTNLTDWLDVGSVTSPTEGFFFSNAISGPLQFHRVAFP